MLRHATLKLPHSQGHDSCPNFSCTNLFNPKELPDCSHTHTHARASLPTPNNSSQPPERVWTLTFRSFTTHAQRCFRSHFSIAALPNVSQEVSDQPSHARQSSLSQFCSILMAWPCTCMEPDHRQRSATVQENSTHMYTEPSGIMNAAGASKSNFSTRRSTSARLSCWALHFC